MSSELDVKEIVRRCGGPTALGAKLGIRGTAVSNWRKVPADHMHRVSAFTGIPVEQIRPDLMPTTEAAE